jgi:hypothetical protein
VAVRSASSFKEFAGRSANCWSTKSCARLIPIFDSIARVLIRSARTTLRTAFIERSTARSPFAVEDIVCVELLPMVGKVRLSFTADKTPSRRSIRTEIRSSPQSGDVTELPNVYLAR